MERHCKERKVNARKGMAWHGVRRKGKAWKYHNTITTIK